ncbi:MAG: hypothetical protein AABY22_18915 [Nanoarchaeota archaeon]
MTLELINKIKSWIRDVEKMQPKSAYNILNQILSEVEPDKKSKTIKITVMGGVVTDVDNLPIGWDYELHDYDNS